jgi:hypothetical protein
MMNVLADIAKVYNILEAKLQHSRVPLSLNMLCGCPDLAGFKPTQIRDCLRHMVKKGKVSRVPIFEGRDRVGYIWGKTEAPETVTKPAEKEKESRFVFNPVNKFNPVDKQEEVRLRINPDKSITILTAKFKVTIEVPE